MLEDDKKPASQDLAHENVDNNNLDLLKQAYIKSGKKIYVIENSVSIDDEEEERFAFLFKKPMPAAYDRYMKTMSTSIMKASKAFILDNVVTEQKEKMEATLDEYPALAISYTEKLLKMLGLADVTTVKKL